MNMKRGYPTGNLTLSCDLGYTMDVSGPTLSNNQPNCSAVYTKVTFTVTDDCGRSESCVQRVFIENEGPTIECPAEITLSCINEYEEGVPTGNYVL